MVLKKNKYSTAICLISLLLLFFPRFFQPQARRLPFAVIDASVSVYPEPGRILASVETVGTPDLSVDERYQLSAYVEETGAAGGPRSVHETVPGMREEMVLDARELAAGDYSVRIEFSDPGGELLHSESHGIKWPGRCEKFEGIEILNNFVWELLSEEPVAGGKISGEYGFNLPYDRWLFVRSSAPEFEEGRISVVLRAGGDDEEIIAHVPGGPERLEAMRKVRKGRHSVEVRSEGGVSPDKLEVRAVPEIQHHRWPHREDPYNPVSYDWEWLERHMLPHVNTIYTSGRYPYHIEDTAERWIERGGRWLAYITRAGAQNRGIEDSPRELYEWLRTRPGYDHPMMEGILVDEFPRYSSRDPAIPYYNKAVKMLNKNPELEGKSFNPYVGMTFGTCEESADLSRSSIEGGGYLNRMVYLHSRDSLAEALNEMRRSLYTHIIPQEKKVPNLTRNTVWVFGAFSYPRPWADGYAHVNYNAYLDMQFEMIANHPALFGLGGVHVWRTASVDEELARLFGSMFRHYCIEGGTERLTGHPYLLEHIENPDFAEGLKGWLVEPAEKGSIFTERLDDFGGRHFRYYSGPDTFMVMKRSDQGPNVARQEIRGLEEGELYSAKMLSGDYSAMLEGVSKERIHPVRLEIKGVESLSRKGSRYGYQKPFHTLGDFLGFSREEPFWLNYHWQVFRAEGPSAEIRITDWESPDEAGSPRVESVLCTYVEIKPFIDEDVCGR